MTDTIDDNKPKLVSIDCKKSETELSESDQYVIAALEDLLSEAKAGNIKEIVSLYEHKETGHIYSFCGIPSSYYKTLYHLERTLPISYEETYIAPPDEYYD